jgi:TatA/E family protein of Tat protein translocase
MLAEVFGMDGIIVLIVVVAVLFGGAAIPKLARSLGSAKGEFEDALHGSQRSTTSAPVAPEALPVTVPAPTVTTATPVHAEPPT